MNQDNSCYNAIIQFQDLCVETVESKYGDNENSIGDFFRMNREKTIALLNALLQTFSKTENTIKQYECLLQQDNIITPEFHNYINTEIDKLKTIQRKALLAKECITFFYFYDVNKNKDFTYFFNNISTLQINYKINETIIHNYSQNFSPSENRVMAEYPQFKKDYHVLIEKGYMSKKGDYLTWNKSKQSLAEYFGNQTAKEKNISWKPIETLFDIRNLSSAFSRNGNSYKKESKDYVKLLELLK